MSQEELNVFEKYNEDLQDSDEDVIAITKDDFKKIKETTLNYRDGFQSQKNEIKELKSKADKEVAEKSEPQPQQVDAGITQELSALKSQINEMKKEKEISSLSERYKEVKDNPEVVKRLLQGKEDNSQTDEDFLKSVGYISEPNADGITKEMDIEDNTQQKPNTSSVKMPSKKEMNDADYWLNLNEEQKEEIFSKNVEAHASYLEAIRHTDEGKEMLDSFPGGSAGRIE